MAGWKVAESLDQLLGQLNALAPRRSKVSDGSIGNAEHASRSSDHNPWWALAGQAYVTARDYTHDLAGGLDCGWLASALQAGRDQRVKYVIWNRRIMAGTAGPGAWTWRPYSGANAHTHHLHLSVVPDARSLVRIPWQLATNPVPTRNEEDDMTPDQARMLAEIHHELTTRLPNRRGENGCTIPNGGADTILGYAANADGATARASWTLAEIQKQISGLADLVRTTANAAGADPKAFADEVSRHLADRLDPPTSGG